MAARSKIPTNWRRMLGNCPRLTKEEELDAYHRKDFDLLVRSQLPWAVRLATQIARNHPRVDIDDAISEAFESLCRSVRLFDATTGFRLTTYVYRNITWSVIKNLEKQNRGIGLKCGIKVGCIGDCYNVSDRKAITPTSMFDMPTVSDVMDHLRSHVSDRDVRVMELRFEGNKLSDIGRTLGISKERVRQIVTRSIDIILADKKFKHYVYDGK